jgi:hypothetical protein
MADDRVAGSGTSLDGIPLVETPFRT